VRYEHGDACSSVVPASWDSAVGGVVEEVPDGESTTRRITLT